MNCPGISYEVKEGDTLWGIAENFFGSGAEWRRIVAYNNNCFGLGAKTYIKNPNMIHPGDQIRIPVVARQTTKSLSLSSKPLNIPKRFVPASKTSRFAPNPFNSSSKTINPKVSPVSSGIASSSFQFAKSPKSYLQAPSVNISPTPKAAAFAALSHQWDDISHWSLPEIASYLTGVDRSLAVADPTQVGMLIKDYAQATGYSIQNKTVSFNFKPGQRRVNQLVLAPAILGRNNSTSLTLDLGSGFSVSSYEEERYENFDEITDRHQAQINGGGGPDTHFELADYLMDPTKRERATSFGMKKGDFGASLTVVQEGIKTPFVQPGVVITGAKYKNASVNLIDVTDGPQLLGTRLRLINKTAGVNNLTIGTTSIFPESILGAGKATHKFYIRFGLPLSKRWDLDVINNASHIDPKNPNIMKPFGGADFSIKFTYKILKKE